MTTLREYTTTGPRDTQADVSLPIEQPNYVRTFWTRDAYGIPPQTNLYGVHKFFVNQKVGDNPSASGVFMLSSQGLDIKFPEEGKYIEYNSIGGVADFFFFNGPQPVDVVRQGVSIWGASNEVPYWSLGVSSEKRRTDSSTTAAAMDTRTSLTWPRLLLM